MAEGQKDPAKPSAKSPAKTRGNQAAKKKKVSRRFKSTGVSQLASSFLSPAIRAKGFAQAEVVTKWPQIVGKELAGATVPKGLIFPRGEKMGAKLVVRCESAFAPLLTMKTPHIIEMVNRFFGYGAVATLEIKQGPLPAVKRRAPLEKHELTIEEEHSLEEIVGTGELSPLQQAIKSLGEMVISNKDKK
jgi:hypothetical protein